MITQVKPGECHCVNCCNERKKIMRAEAKRKKIADKEVKFQLLIAGRVRDLHFGKVAVEIWTKHLQQDSLERTFTYGAIYGGLYESNFRKQIEKDYTFKDVVQWVDTLSETKQGQKEIQRICKGFSNAPQYVKFIEQIEASNLITE